MKREFLCQDDASNKFWTVEVSGRNMLTSNGRIGSKPRETRKQFADAETASRAAEKAIAAKLEKGYVEKPIASAAEHVGPDWAAMVMDEETFWRIIRLFRWKNLGDDEAVIAPAVKALSHMSVESMRRFEDVLAAKLFALDTEEHARNIGEDAYNPPNHFSVDSFLYARCAVVANGRDVYESILMHPAHMPRDLEFESLLSLTSAAHELKTGKQWRHATSVSYETFSNRQGWGKSKRLGREKGGRRTKR